MALVPRWRLSIKVRAAWTVSLSLYSAAVGVLLILDKTLKPDTLRWVHNPKLTIWVVSILAGLTFVDAAKRTFHRVRASQIEKHRIEIRNQLATVIVTVAELHHLDIGDVGCGLFLVQPRGLKRPPRLVRTERVRLVDDLHESEVLFTKGKGTVGACWEHQRPAHFDWIRINSQFAEHPDLTKKHWHSLSPEMRRNFAQDEFVSLVGKYAEVLAIPVMINSKFEGCLALDRRWNKDDPADRSLLNDQPTKSVLGLAVKTLQPLLKK